MLPSPSTLQSTPTAIIWKSSTRNGGSNISWIFHVSCKQVNFHSMLIQQRRRWTTNGWDVDEKLWSWSRVMYPLSNWMAAAAAGYWIVDKTSPEMWNSLNQLAAVWWMVKKQWVWQFSFYCPTIRWPMVAMHHWSLMGGKIMIGNICYGKNTLWKSTLTNTNKYIKIKL